MEYAYKLSMTMAIFPFGTVLGWTGCAIQVVGLVGMFVFKNYA